MDTGNVSLADIAAVTDKNDGMFGGGTGGRTLAARSLAKSGMGIKISSDGGITAYIGKGETPVFSIG